MTFFFITAVFIGVFWIFILWACAGLLFDYPMKPLARFRRIERLLISAFLLLMGWKLNAIASEEISAAQLLRPRANVAGEFALIAFVSTLLVLVAICLHRFRRRRRRHPEERRRQEAWKEDRARWAAFQRDERLRRKNLPNPKRHRRRRSARKR